MRHRKIRLLHADAPPNNPQPIPRHEGSPPTATRSDSLSPAAHTNRRDAITFLAGIWGLDLRQKTSANRVASELVRPPRQNPPPYRTGRDGRRPACRTPRPAACSSSPSARRACGALPARGAAPARGPAGTPGNAPPRRESRRAAGPPGPKQVPHAATALGIFDAAGQVRESWWRQGRAVRREPGPLGCLAAAVRRAARTIRGPPSSTDSTRCTGAGRASIRGARGRGGFYDRRGRVLRQARVFYDGRGFFFTTGAGFFPRRARFFFSRRARVFNDRRGFFLEKGKRAVKKAPRSPRPRRAGRPESRRPPGGVPCKTPRCKTPRRGVLHGGGVSCKTPRRGTLK